VPPSKAILSVLSNPGKTKHPSSGFLDQRSQSDSDMTVTVRYFYSMLFLLYLYVMSPLANGLGFA